MIDKLMQPVYLLIAIMAILFCPMAFAQTSASSISSLDVSKLTAEQKATLIANVAALEKEEKSPANVSKTIRTEAEAWGDLGGNMGRAAVSAAKEIGMAANDFVQTPLGKVTMGIIVYKIVGASLLKVFFGTFVLLFSYSLAMWFLLRKKYDSAEYENRAMFWGLYNRKLVTKFSTDDTMTGWHWVCAAVLLVVGSLVGLNLIF
jgi:hypothetical protein